MCLFDQGQVKCALWLQSHNLQDCVEVFLCVLRTVKIKITFYFSDSLLCSLHLLSSSPDGRCSFSLSRAFSWDGAQTSFRRCLNLYYCVRIRHIVFSGTDNGHCQGEGHLASFSSLLRVTHAQYWSGSWQQGVVISKMEATNSGHFLIFNFNLSFKLSADWTMFEPCLSREGWKSLNEPASLTSTSWLFHISTQLCLWRFSFIQ